MTTLPPFNDDPECSKCGWHQASMQYRPYPLTKDGPDASIVGEHMLRVCERCNYHWRERIMGDDGNRQPWPSGVSPRTYNSLVKAGIHSLAEADSRTDEDLARIRNLGRVGVAEIRALARGEEPPESVLAPPRRVHYYRSFVGAPGAPCGVSAYPDAHPDLTDDATEVTCKLCIARLERWDRRMSA